MVVAAGHRSSPGADDALQSLCESYWYPLYAFARRTGCSRDDAADATQEFFVRLLDRDFLKSADQERGRFRTFLLTVFKRFLTNEHERQNAQKRGGGLRHFSIDFEAGEERYQFEPADDRTPESVFERRWALTLLDRVVARLREEYESKDKAELFRHGQAYLGGSTGAPGYSVTAEALQVSEGAVRIAVHRMRERYREILLEEVAGTVEDPDAVEEELESLRRAIRGEAG